VRKNQPAFLQISQRKKLVFSQVKIIRRALSFVSQAMLASNVKAASGHATLSVVAKSANNAQCPTTVPLIVTTWGIWTTWTIISASDAVLV
jgi:hypothetical protein